MTIIGSTGHDGEELLRELEQLWGQRAIAPSHDTQRAGWLTCASVLVMASVACVLGGWAAGARAPFVAAGVALMLAVPAGVCHRRGRAFRIPGRPR